MTFWFLVMYPPTPRIRIFFYPKLNLSWQMEDQKNILFKVRFELADVHPPARIEKKNLQKIECSFLDYVHVTFHG